MAFLKLESTKDITIYTTNGGYVNFQVTDDKTRNETLDNIKQSVYDAHRSTDWMLTIMNNDPDGEIQAIDTSSIVTIAVSVIQS